MATGSATSPGYIEICVRHPAAVNSEVDIVGFSEVNTAGEDRVYRKAWEDFDRREDDGTPEHQQR